MNQVEWKPVASNLPQVDYVAQAKEFLNPQQAVELTAFGSPTVTPQDYFSGEFANKVFNSQQQMFDRMTQQEAEMKELREHSFKERERLIGLMGEQAKAYSNSSVSDYRKAHSGSFEPNKWQQQDTQGIMYKTFREKGLDHNQALGLIMNVSAENDFGDRYVFGTHSDGGKTAYGALSWQGGREVPLLKKLASEGLYDPNTKQIKQTERALQIQAEYMVEELKSGKQGNYLNFTAKDPLEYARYANKTYTRSSTDENVLRGRERQYQKALQSRDWNNYLNQNANNQGLPEYSNSLKQLRGGYWDTKYGKRSLTNLQGVNPQMIDLVNELAKQYPDRFVVTEGLRTLDRQQQLLNQGRSKTMNSYHLSGNAMDIYPIVNGKVIVGDGKSGLGMEQELQAFDELNKLISPLAKNKGINLDWGGNWKSFKDKPHYQILGSNYDARNKLKQIRRG